MATERYAYKSAFQPVDGATSGAVNSHFMIKNLLNLESPPEWKPNSEATPPCSFQNVYPLALTPLVPRPLKPVHIGATDFSSFQLYPPASPPFPSYPAEEQTLASLYPIMPAWMHATRMALPGFNPFLKHRKRFMRKPKQRPLFSHSQVQRLEKEFAEERYLTESKRAELSKDLGMTETQVKTWFQNRRTKWRKELKDEVTLNAQAQENSEWGSKQNNGNSSRMSEERLEEESLARKERIPNIPIAYQDSRTFIDLSSLRPRFVYGATPLGR